MIGESTTHTPGDQPLDDDHGGFQGYAPTGGPPADARLLAAHLTAVRDQVRRAVAVRQLDDPDPTDRFRGLYISDEQAERLLDAPGTGGAAPPIDDEVRLALDDIEAAVDAWAASGAPPRIRRMRAEFGLDRVDEHILHIALAPDIDTGFERLYGYLNDNVSFRRASVALALELCGLAPWDGVARARLSPSGALVRGGLLVIDDGDRPFLTRSLRVPDRVIAHLLGDDTPDSDLVDLLVGHRPIDLAGTEVLARALQTTTRLVYLEQPPTGPARAFAAAALDRLAWPTVPVDLTRLAACPDPVAVARAVDREARLVGGAVVAGPAEDLAEHAPEALRALADGTAPVVLVGSRNWDPRWSREVPLLLDAPSLDPAHGADLWRGLLAERDYGPGPSPDEATRPFRLSPEQIERATVSAIRQAIAHDRPVDARDVRHGARAQNAAGLEQLARRIEPVVAWDDLVLPAAVVRHMRELVAQVRQRTRVYDEWGMSAGSSKGRGVKALFTGESGTGKTASAEAVANELGLDLYVIDLSTVVDKYVGETEKNLDRIFDEADRVNGVLLFDEADALFGKRSEVKQAQDRYANVEVAYLLQRMEQFEGLAVLTSNLRTNLDEAFARRLDAIVDFPKPEAPDRLLLWQRHMRPTMPQTDGIDLPFLAEAFDLTGGNIRNVCLGAAFLAAEGGRPVGMADLIRATEREYQKLGRLLLPDEFGEYFELLAGGTDTRGGR